MASTRPSGQDPYPPDRPHSLMRSVGNGTPAEVSRHPDARQAWRAQGAHHGDTGGDLYYVTRADRGQPL